MESWELETAEELERAYPDCRRVAPPQIEGARRAWRIPLRPFSTNEPAVPIVCDLEAGADVRVLNGGTLHHDPDCHGRHIDLPYKSALVRMDREFEVVLVEFGAKRNPRVFCFKPVISGRSLPTHPHLRRDQIAVIDGTPMDALCTYFASDGVYTRDSTALVRVMDFTAIFLGKHVVWLRTAKLECRRQGRTTRILDVDTTGLSLHFEPKRYRNEELVWTGHWPGPSAPHDPAEMLTTVAPDCECPCGSGNPYATCCREDHRRAADIAERG